MIGHLKEMFQEKARIERFNTIKALLPCKLTASGSVSPHVLKMKGHLEHLDKLGLKIDNWLLTLFSNLCLKLMMVSS